MSISPSSIHSIHTQQDFLRFLSSELSWPIPDDLSFEDVTFDLYPDELGIKREELRGSTIAQIRPFVQEQPWGIFILQLKQPRLYLTELRKILRALEPMKRKLKDYKTWNPQHILFICTNDWKSYTFAHFEGENSGKAKISSFGWEYQSDFIRTLCEFNIPQLVYPQTTDMFGLDPVFWLKQWASAFDVEKVTEEFFKTYKKIFVHAENTIKGISGDEKHLFTQKLFNRLLFIRFLEKKGWLKLNDRTDYLHTLWEEYQKEKKRGDTFYKNRLVPLFFAALNTPHEVNVIDINRGGFLGTIVGQVPYLNGGLFEKDETDENQKISIPDEVIEPVLSELFYHFNFTVTESTPLDIEVAVDPEMLGKIFEELVTGRHESGSYYTPRTIVSFMCREALKGYLGNYDTLVDEHDTANISVPEAKELRRKIENVKVVDPACGSGAYLLGMLHELHALIKLLDTSAQDSARDDYERKLKIIQNCLYGTDLDAFATNIAKLRLWLSLAVEFEGANPPPLPNLDFKIEIGDSLTAPDPQEFGSLFRDQIMKQADLIAEMKGRHMRTHGEEQKKLRKEISIEEQKLEVYFKDHPAPKLSFDWRIKFAEVFVHKGFDIVVANPPYGVKCEDPLRFQYFPKVKGEDPQSKDSYGLFIARGLQLLKEDGQFTYIISDTWRTIRSHRPLRKLLVNRTTVMHVLDLPSWIFKATVNTCILTLQKKKPVENHSLISGDLRNIANNDWRMLEANLSAVSVHAIDLQTITFARYTYPQTLISTYDNLSFFIGSPKLYRIMSDKKFVKLGTIADVKVGLQTSDNEYFIRKRQSARGSYEILDESKLLNENDITEITDVEKQNGVDPKKHDGKHFLPYDKGGESDSDEGWLPNYFVPTEYFIDWSKKSVKRLHTASIADVKRRQGEEATIKTGDEDKQAAVIRNPEYYFQYGITFSPTGIYSPSFRIGCGAIFGNKGSTIFFKDNEIHYYLGVLSSMLTRYLLKVYRSHTVETGEEVIGQLPLLQIDQKNKDAIIAKVNGIISKQKKDGDYRYHLEEQKEIDKLLYELYSLEIEDIVEIELWYCRRYQHLAKAQGLLSEVQEKNAAYLSRAETILSKPAKYWKSHPLLELIARGEGTQLEFKETLEADIKTGQKHEGVLQSSLKTIAAYLNTNGGKLLIGVSDGSEIKGLARDYKLCGKHDKDGFELKLRSLISSRFNPKPLGFIDISFESLPEGEICVVTVKNLNKPEVVHLDDEIYVRDGNGTRKLEGPDLTHWISQRAKL